MPMSKCSQRKLPARCWSVFCDCPPRVSAVFFLEWGQSCLVCVPWHSMQMCRNEHHENLHTHPCSSSCKWVVSPPGRIFDACSKDSLSPPPLVSHRSPQSCGPLRSTSDTGELVQHSQTQWSTRLCRVPLAGYAAERLPASYTGYRTLPRGSLGIGDLLVRSVSCRP